MSEADFQELVFRTLGPSATEELPGNSQRERAIALIVTMAKLGREQELPTFAAIVRPDLDLSAFGEPLIGGYNVFDLKPLESKGKDRASVEISLRERLADFKQDVFVWALGKLLNIPYQNLNILRTSPGSSIVEVEMPLRAANHLSDALFRSFKIGSGQTLSARRHRTVSGPMVEPRLIDQVLTSHAIVRIQAKCAADSAG